MSSTTGQARNRRYIRVSQQRKTKLHWLKKSIEHQNVHRRRSNSSSARIYIRVYTSEADFHKPGIYGGRVRVWANEWDVFRCTPSRGGRGRRAAVDIFRAVFFLVSGEISFFISCSLLRTHRAYCKYEARSRERNDRGRYFPLGKKASAYQGAYRVPLFNWSVSVCMCV